MSSSTLERPGAEVEPIAGWPPRWLTPVPAEDLARGDGDLYADVLGTVGRVTKNSFAAPAGERLVIRPWQREVMRHVFARRPDGLLRHRTSLVGMPRKQGKSALGSGVALCSMMFGGYGGEVYSCAATKDQAGLVFEVAKKMVELDPELSRIFKPYRNTIAMPSTDTTYKALSAEAFTKEGLNPTFVVFDEVHAQPTRELWDVMALAMGARVEPMMFGITTAGVRVDRTGQDSLCYGMYQLGQQIARGEVVDDSFFMAWWEPVRGAQADHRDLATWRESNPGFGDIVNPEDFESAVRKTPEAEFRTKRTNVFVSSARTWLPVGTWDALAAPERYPDGPPSGTPAVIGLDGSRTGDSTALIGVTVEEVPHMWVVGMWEKDPRDLNWRVPRAEVKETIRQARRTWDVKEFPWDEYGWQDAAEELRDEDFPIEAYPQTPERMGRATQRFYEEVMDLGFTHDGDPRMARHVANATPKPTGRGYARIVKESPDSTKRIDGAVTGVFTLERALWWRDSGGSAYDDRGLTVL